jgi:molecular chaperone GrpE (heat shock protein)
VTSSTQILDHELETHKATVAMLREELLPVMDAGRRAAFIVAREEQIVKDLQENIDLIHKNDLRHSA